MASFATIIAKISAIIRSINPDPNAAVRSMDTILDTVLLKSEGSVLLSDGSTFVESGSDVSAPSISENGINRFLIVSRPPIALSYRFLSMDMPLIIREHT
jgi:hypothetical protein